VHRPAGGLDQENVLLAHILKHAHEDVLVRELEDLDVAHARLEAAADTLRQGSARLSGVDAELVGVHVGLLAPISRERFYWLASHDQLAAGGGWVGSGSSTSISGRSS